ncbi:MAG TPA: DUF5666 domain-containing protein [Candidatus Paceibacterota bacterium]
MYTFSRTSFTGMIIGAVILIMLAFFIGTKVAHSKMRGAMRGEMGTMRAGQRGNTGFGMGMGGNFVAGAQGGMMRRAGGNAAMGKILSVDATSITVQMGETGSKIIMISPSTTVSKSAAGTITDLKVGEEVMVMGTPNADGSISATNVSIRPAAEVKK